MRARTSIAVVIAALTSLPALADRPAPNPRQYQNSDYQFSVVLPPDLLACVGEITNHGVVILLDRSKKCDGDYFRSPGIFVNANYNAADIGNTPQALAAVECRWGKARHIVWLDDERIGGRKAAGCRRSFADGHIEVSYIVLRKTGGIPLGWIEVRADLITTPARYATDRRIFRRVLRGIWVHPDGPQD